MNILKNALCRTKKIAETISKSVEDVMTEDEATSKKVSQTQLSSKIIIRSCQTCSHFFLFFMFRILVCSLAGRSNVKE